MTQAVELIRLQVSEARASEFVAGRTAVDSAMTALGGFVNTELIHVSSDQWLLIVRWRDHASVVAAQAITRDMPVISEWIARADKFVSFDTADVVYQSS